MELNEFTIPLTKETVTVRCDAQARFTVKSGRKVLEDTIMSATALGGAFTVACIVYNGLSMSGGTSWRDPKSGTPLTTPRVTMRVRPEDILADGQECGCAECSRQLQESAA